MGRRPRHRSFITRLLAFVVIFGFALVFFYWIGPIYLAPFFTSISGGSAATATDYLDIVDYLVLIVGFVGGLYAAWKL